MANTIDTEALLSWVLEQIIEGYLHKLEFIALEFITNHSWEWWNTTLNRYEPISTAKLAEMYEQYKAQVATP